MSNTYVFPTNPFIGQEVTQGGTRKRWDGEKWKNVSFGNHEVRIEANTVTLSAILQAEGYSGDFGLFVRGFTYTEAGDLGVDTNNKFWKYTGTSFPHEVPRGTDPGTSSDYTPVIFGTSVEVDASNVVIGSADIKLDEYINNNDLTISGLLKTQGLSGKYGFFSKGFTIDDANDVGITSAGEIWQYVGTSPIPYTVAAGTVPNEGDYSQVFYNTVDAKNVTFDDGKTLEQFREDLPEEEVDDGYALKNIAATYVIDSNKLSIYPSSGNVVTDNYYLFERNGVAEVWRANNTIRTSDPKVGNFTLLPRSDRGGVLLTSQLSSLNLDVSSGSVFKFTLTSQITQLQFDNIPTEQGKTVEVTLILKQGIGSQKVTWPSSIKWQNGREPVLSYKLDAEDIIVFTFVNGVTTPYAYFVSGWQL